MWTKNTFKVMLLVNIRVCKRTRINVLYQRNFDVYNKRNE